MPKLSVFNSVSLDGFISDPNGDMSWAHKSDPEWNAFVAGNAQGGGRLLFGRVTYDMMVAWWPTPAAMASMPNVAERMNNLPKVVFSRTLPHASWSNTRLVSSGLIDEVKKLKQDGGPDMVILGSASIVSQLAQEGLIDAYQLVVNPVLLGKGKSMFAGLRQPLPLKRTEEKAFGNGNVVLSYVPA